MILDEIVKTKRDEVRALKSSFRFPAAADLPPLRDFRAAIVSGGLKLIAEVKSSSPSAGKIVEKYDPAAIAVKYAEAGAAAVSVLTDRDYFGGDISHIRIVKGSVPLPVLRKDFVIDQVQISEARAAGADAVLLIVRLLKADQLERFITAANDLGMTPLVEVRSVQETRAALKAGADVIGINNRDLDTLKVDLGTTIDIIKSLPQLREKTVVSESGIKDASDVKSLRKAGVTAILVGESILRSADVGAKIRELLSQ